LEEKQSAVDLARRLALDATLQTKADGSMVWANPEGHSFLDKFARFTKEAKAQRGQLDALEARLSSREKEVQSSSLKLVELERALLAQERELESQKVRFLIMSLEADQVPLTDAS
jgi:chromosome segregation ATPase